jgi:putative NIF3 family GTP cyclohydrolase 1 type 2
MKAVELDSYLRNLLGRPIRDLPQIKLNIERMPQALASFYETHDGTVDRIVYGNRDRNVKCIAVTWIAYSATIEQAAALGANILVTHEPTFYNRLDLDGIDEITPELGRKIKLLEELEMTVIRCHDVWDLRFPEPGILSSWASFIGLNEAIVRDGYFAVYEVAPQSALSFAKTLATKTRSLGQSVVGFYGDQERTIRRVGIGTGAASDPFRLFQLGADLAVVADDAPNNTAWKAGAWCHDTEKPVVIVNHAVAEAPGISALASHLRETFPRVQVYHIDQSCSFLEVQSE